MRYIPRALLTGGLGFALAVLVAACGGSSGLLSASQSGNLNNQLDAVASAINNGNCTRAGAAAQSFDSAVANLPSSVDATLTNNLKQASTALAQRAQPDCASSQTASIPTTTKATTTPTTSTATKTTPTATTQTSTTPANTSTGTTTPTSPATTGTSTGSTTTNPSGGAGVGGTGTSTGGGGGAPVGNGQ